MRPCSARGVGRRIPGAHTLNPRPAGSAGSAGRVTVRVPYASAMRRLTLAAVVLSLLAAACGDDGAAVTTTAGPTTTTAGPTTTTVPPATTRPPTTAPATTEPPTTPATTAPPPSDGFVLEHPDLFPPPPLPGSDGANGSGCAPDSTTVVPDGIWFGFVLAKTDTDITFDMACWFWGEVADEKAAEDGVIEDGGTVENGYYIRNQNPLTYAAPIGPDATMYFLSAALSDSGSFETFPIAMSDWPGPDQEWPCPGEFCGVWIYVNGGVITDAYEQYRP